MQAITLWRQTDYEPDAIAEKLLPIFEALRAAGRLTPGMRVVLKPNLLMRRAPEEGTTTHPAVVVAAARCLQAVGVRDIILADSPGGPYNRALLEGLYQTCGMADAARRTGLRLNLDCSARPARNEAGRVCREFNLIRPVAEADFVLNLCKLKTHCMTTLSGAVKNLFGVIPGLQKPQLHYRYPERARFCEMLLDLCETVRPGLTIVDAVVSMEGDGPSGGSLRATGFLAAGESPYALDYLLAHIIGLVPFSVDTIRLAHQRGLGPGSLQELELRGDPAPVFADFRPPRSKGVDFSGNLPGFLKRPVTAVVNRFLAARPVVDEAKCVGCGRCTESCPPQTIAIRQGKAVICYKNCVRCFCCHEMCPVRAIDLQRGRRR